MTCNATQQLSPMPAQSPVRYESMLVTPDVAADWLRKNHGNRPVRKARLARYAKDMAAGKWKDIGQPIIFGKSGRMLNGQHRCRAVIESGETVLMSVAYNVDDSSFAYMDDGAPRSFADVLIEEGWGPWEARTGATAARYCMAFAADTKLTTQCSNHEGRDFVLDHPTLMDSVRLMSSLPRRPAPVPHSLAAFIHYQMVSAVGKAGGVIEPDNFIRALWLGDNLSSDSVVLQLRNKLLGRALAGDPVPVDIAALAISRVWNGLRRGRAMRHISNAFRVDDTPLHFE